LEYTRTRCNRYCARYGCTSYACSSLSPACSPNGSR
jgi:hypothetical protein